MMGLILHFGVFFLAFVPDEVCFPAGKRRETGAVLPPLILHPFSHFSKTGVFLAENCDVRF